MYFIEHELCATHSDVNQIIDYKVDFDPHDSNPKRILAVVYQWFKSENVHFINHNIHYVMDFILI